MKFVIRALSLAAIALSAAGASAQSPIRTGIDATFAPHAMPRLGGGLEGFNIDLANELAKRMGRPITIEGTEFSALIPGLNAGRYDFLIAPTTVTPERAKNLLFTEGYMETDYMFVQRKGEPPLATLDDLKGKRIAVNKGSAYENWAKANAEKHGFQFDVFGTNADAVQAVLSRRVDANMAGHTNAMWAAKQNQQLSATMTIKTGLVWAMPFRKDDKAGRDAVSMHIKCMKRDGTVARLHEKWFGLKPSAESWVNRLAPGHGVPDMEGYDATPVTPSCS